MHHQVAFRNSIRQLHPQPVRLLKWVLIRGLGEGGLPGRHLQPGDVPQQHLRHQHRYGIHIRHSSFKKILNMFEIACLFFENVRIGFNYYVLESQFLLVFSNF